MLLNLYLLALLFMLPGYPVNKAQEPVYFGQKFILGQSEQVTITDSVATGETIILSWRSMTDSRCPSDVKCITAGEAVLSLQLLNEQLQTLPVNLKQPGTSPAVGITTSNTIQLGSAKYNIKLLRVSPYPSSNRSMQIPQAELILERI